MDLGALLPACLPECRAPGTFPITCSLFLLRARRSLPRVAALLENALATGPGFRFQVHARVHEAPIDELRLSMSVLDDTPVHAGPSVGSYIHGPFLVGARWDAEDGTLAESHPMKLHMPIGRIWLEPVPIATPTLETAYECPLYQTAARARLLSTSAQSSNLICVVPLPAGTAGKALWIQRGVAMLSQLSD